MPACYGHGLVIGKFYPLHRGHQLLIDTAAAACDRLTVVPMAAAIESVPLEVRVAWLRELYADQPHVRISGQRDDLPVDLTSEQAWSDHTAMMRAAVARAAIIDGRPELAPVDVVFTSETCGVELARRCGAAAVTVDVARGTVPTSGTALRADPVAGWGRLRAPVRRTLVRRVVVVGAESTGTTTLSRDLQAALRARGAASGQTPAGSRRWAGSGRAIC